MGNLTLSVNKMKISKALFIILSLYFTYNSHATDVYAPYLSLLGFKLEESTLYEIKEELGDATIIQSGNVTKSDFSICYTSGKNTIYFNSNEMGGNRHRLLSFSVKNYIHKQEQCGHLTVHDSDLQLGNIKIGTNIKTVISLIPQPVENIKGYGYLHKHYSKLPFSEKDIERTRVKNMDHAFWSVLIFIEVFTENDKINGFKVSKSTSW